MELFCPRDFGEIETEEDLRKHLFCYACRQHMIKIRWLEHNGYTIESRFHGILNKLSKVFEENKAFRMTELSESIKSKMEIFVRTGSSGDRYIDKILHGMYKWIAPGKIQKRVQERRSAMEE
jgi:hypothetical protein